MHMTRVAALHPFDLCSIFFAILALFLFGGREEREGFVG